MKRFFSFLLVLVLVLCIIPALGTEAEAATTKTLVGVEINCDGYHTKTNQFDETYYYLNIGDTVTGVFADGTKADVKVRFLDTLYYAEDFRDIHEEPIPGETYAFYMSIEDEDGMTISLSESKCSLKVNGFCAGRVEKISGRTIYWDLTCGELTGGVKAYAAGLFYYDSSTDSVYEPLFLQPYTVSVDGEKLEYVESTDTYDVDYGRFYKTRRGSSFSDPLTTAPVVGETYYSYILLDSLDGNLYIDEDLVDIRIAGYDVQFLDAYEGDMGFTSRVIYSATKLPNAAVYVGGVGMNDGDYLAVGAAKTTKTKPSSGGYAYYNNGKLTLNNYTYDGPGYRPLLQNYDKYGQIYRVGDLTLELIGDNCLEDLYDAVHSIRVVEGSLSVQGEGSLTLQNPGQSGLYADQNVILDDVYVVANGCEDNGILSLKGDITVNGGHVYITAQEDGMDTLGGDVTISDSIVTIAAQADGISAYDFLTIDGGTLNITAYNGLVSEWEKIIVKNGTVNIKATTGAFAYYEGVLIEGGDVNITAEEFGIRARWSDFEITGGTLDITAATDSGICLELEQIRLGQGMRGFSREVSETRMYPIDNEPGDKGYFQISFFRADIYVGGVGMNDGDYLATGAAVVSSTKPNGGYAYYKDGVLTLNSYTYSGTGNRCRNDVGDYSIIFADRDLTINLQGTNSLNQTEDDYIGIMAWNRQDYPLLTIEGPGILTITGGKYGINAEDELLINSGNLIVFSSAAAIKSTLGSVTVNGGNVSAMANGSSGCAISVGEDFLVSDRMKIRASTTAGGTLGDYVAGKLSTYKKIDMREIAVNVGSVGMATGEYLAVGATEPTTTKPSVGYAYYDSGTLTLNNYSYQGMGYDNGGYGAAIYTEKDLTICLQGDSTLVQTEQESDGIYVDGASLTFTGAGSLTVTDNGYGIYATNSITVNSGTITSNGYYNGLRAYYGDIVINGGNVTALGNNALKSDQGSVIVNGGTVTAFGNTRAVTPAKDFTVSPALKVQAATTLTGAPSVYIEANLASYKHIVIAKPDIFVGGVALGNGEYLAVGATTPTATQPSGGFAYYNNGTLALSNYRYEGEGYDYGGYNAIIYTTKDLFIVLDGTNTLVQTAEESESIYVKGSSLTFDGTGSLTSNADGYGIYADKVITVDGGTINTVGGIYGLHSEAGTVIVNDGYLSASGKDAAIYTDEIKLGEGLKIRASTTMDGTLGAYDAANHDSYKKIVIGPEKLATPAITKFENAANGIKITWGKVTGAERYRVYAKTSTGWKNLGSTTGNTYTYTAAESGKTYAFTIRCVNADNTAFTSDFNATGWKQTFVGVPTVSLFESTPSGLKITWNEVDGAAKYRVFVKTSSGWAKLADTTATSYTYAAAKNGTTYTFTIRCLSADGKSFTSAYNTAGWKHTYNPAPVVTKLESTATGIKLTWNAFSGAGKYRVYLQQEDGGWTKVGDTASTTFTWTGAKSGKTYTFTVRAMNAAASAFVSGYNPSGWSITYNPAPVVTKLESTTTGIKLTWNAFSGAGKYRVFVKTSTGWAKLADTASTSYTYTGAKAGQTYIFTVRAMNAGATAFVSSYNTTGWSHKYTPTPAITKLESAANGIKLTWGKINGAEKYRVFVKASTGWTKVGDTTGTSLVYTAASLGKSYTFTVRGLSADGKSYTTAYNTAGWKCTFSPVPEAKLANAANGIQISWGKINGAEKYRVFVKTSTGWTKLADTTSTSYTWTGAKSGQTYTFTVRCLSADGKTYTSSYNATGWSIKRN